jgi:L-seryl-tRNA(Ser) seleniumtransferase
MKDLLRRIPQVDTVLRHKRWQELDDFPGNVAKDHLRCILEELRQSIKEGKADASDISTDAIIDETKKRSARSVAPALKRVINGTGVILHTNMGRALLAASALERLTTVASGYSNLEYDLEKGERGDRYVHSVLLLTQLTGAEAAVVVNNNAAAVLLVLNTLAEGREVVVGRGELVEIGGSFRIPEVMKKSGAILAEVGTTNRTFTEDYERAIGENTGLIMKAHTSNYKIRGFVHETSSDEISRLARKYTIPFYFDIGSGLFFPPDGNLGLSEPIISEEARKDIDVMSFSGDKLLGGPQCGIILGKKALIQQIRKNPLTRALRPDKFTLAALEATLLLYLDDQTAKREIPVLHMLYQDEESLKRRAGKIVRALRRKKVKSAVEAIQLYSEIGGGSAPDTYISSWGLSFKPDGVSVARFEAALRSLDTPIIARIEKDHLLIDLRTVREMDEADLLLGLTSVLS